MRTPPCTFFGIPATLVLFGHVSFANWMPDKAAQINFFTNTQCTAYNGEVAAWWTLSPLVGRVGSTTAATGAQCFNLSMPGNSLGIATVNMWFQMDNTTTEPGASSGGCTFWDDYGCSGDNESSDVLSDQGPCRPASSTDDRLWKSAKCWNNNSTGPVQSTSVTGDGTSGIVTTLPPETCAIIFEYGSNYKCRQERNIGQRNSDFFRDALTSRNKLGQEQFNFPPYSCILRTERIPAGAVAGIVVALIILLLALAVASISRCRVLHRHGASTISPFNGAGTALVDSSTRRMTRQRLENQVTAAEEKMAHPEGLEKSATPGTTGSSVAHGMSRLMSGSSPVRREVGSPNLEVQLQAARDQINILVARMNAIEANTEPPPQYA
ncbi:hypothetical protein B0H13DRAFT_2349023 [Mycena leptocephala]|nr:hypothetical protein B0H13DRAFT_2349023 [Mycena leptocephala]